MVAEVSRDTRLDVLKKSIASLVAAVSKLIETLSTLRSIAVKDPEVSLVDWTICWYHHKFGNKATECIRVCTFYQKKLFLLGASAVTI